MRGKDDFAYFDDKALYLVDDSSGERQYKDSIAFIDKDEWLEKHPHHPGEKAIYVSVATVVGNGQAFKDLVLNIGESEDEQAIWGRYSKGKYSEQLGAHRVIAQFKVKPNDEFKCKEIDTWIHEQLDLKLKTVPRKKGESKEFRVVSHWESIEELLSLLEELVEQVGSTSVNRKELPPYEDIISLVVDTLSQGIKQFTYGWHVVANLCCRYGKTMMACLYWRLSGARISVLSAYVGTVGTSYKNLINTTKGYEDTKIVDTTHWGCKTEDEKDKIFSDMESWLSASPNNKVMFIVPLTGTGFDNDEIITNSTFANRAKKLIAFIKKMRKMGEEYIIITDEVDYGSTCPDQVKKLRELAKMEPHSKLSLSGTKADKSKRIWEIDFTKNRDYIDVKEIVYENRKAH